MGRLTGRDIWDCGAPLGAGAYGSGIPCATQWDPNLGLANGNPPVH